MFIVAVIKPYLYKTRLYASRTGGVISCAGYIMLLNFF
jgi:hypothetical protein